MNLSRIYLIAILLLPFGIGANGQELPKAVLIDEFDVLPCSSLRYLLDHFMTELAKEPTSRGYVVNAGPREKLVSIIWREELVKAQIELRQFENSRILFDRSISDRNVRTALWKIPNRGEQPEVANKDNSLSLADRVMPFLLIEDNFFNDSECPDANYTRVFARFLHANPGSRGNLVIFGKTSREIRGREKTVTRAMADEKIGNDRIRVFRRLYRYNPEHPKGIEYWYLP